MGPHPNGLRILTTTLTSNTPARPPAPRCSAARHSAVQGAFLRAHRPLPRTHPLPAATATAKATAEATATASPCKANPNTSTSHSGAMVAVWVVAVVRRGTWTTAHHPTNRTSRRWSSRWRSCWWCHGQRSASCIRHNTAVCAATAPRSAPGQGRTTRRPARRGTASDTICEFVSASPGCWCIVDGSHGLDPRPRIHDPPLYLSTPGTPWSGVGARVDVRAWCSAQHAQPVTPAPAPAWRSPRG